MGQIKNTKTMRFGYDTTVMNVLLNSFVPVEMYNIHKR